MILAVSMPSVNQWPIDQFVDVQTTGLVTHTKNVTNVGSNQTRLFKR